MLYVYFGSPIGTMCPAGGCPFPQFLSLYSVGGLFLAAVMLIIGVLGVWGASFAYRGGAIVCAAGVLFWVYAVAVTSGYGYLSTWTNEGLVGAAASAAAAALNLVGQRSRSGMTEQANPMNLPVFG